MDQDRHTHRRIRRASSKIANLGSALRQRAQVLRAIRTWFEVHEYLEVVTPMRVAAAGMEAHLVPFHPFTLLTPPLTIPPPPAATLSCSLSPTAPPPFALLAALRLADALTAVLPSQ